MLEKYVKKILASRVYDVAVESPLTAAPGLSSRLGCSVLLKREDLQQVHSFKLRGAYNKMASLSAEQLSRGVIAASAGNHAQGVALAARELGVRALIVMGRNAPSIKVSAVKNLGAKVILHGDTFDEAAAHAQTLVAEHGYAFVHAYDDIDTIAGQGTVGMEIMQQTSEPPDAIFVPVGGGGLIAGIAAFVKYLHPQTKIIGVEAEGSACLSAALKAGRRVRLPYETLDLFADGVSVAQVGKEPFKVARRYVDQVVTVTTDEICAAVKDVFDDTRAIAEPSGALAIAGMKKWVGANKPVIQSSSQSSSQSKKGSKNVEPAPLQLVAIVSGANVNFDRLRHVAERAEVGEQRELLLGVAIVEQPGSFQKFCKLLGKRAVTEFNYRYASDKEAHVYVGLQMSPSDSADDLIQAIQTKGHQVINMTADETAKAHVRHMVGGRAFGSKGEWLYRFEFPERPGALGRFLAELGSRWDITLFHYRNHGAAWGRVLVGLAPATDDAKAASQAQLGQYLERIGYRYWEETDNPAYAMFLR